MTMSSGCLLANLISSLIRKEAHGSRVQSLGKAIMLSMGSAIFDMTREEVLGIVWSLAASMKSNTYGTKGIMMYRKEDSEGRCLAPGSQSLGCAP